MSATPATVQAYKARTVLLELLEARGFDVEAYAGSSMVEVHAMLQAKQMDMLVTNPNTGGKAYVKYSPWKALRTNDVYDWVEDLYHIDGTLGSDDELIVIAAQSPNDSIKKVLRDLWTKDAVFITVFGLAHLQFNILKHTLVPSHRALDSAAADAISKKYKISNTAQVPDLSRFSPVAAAIGLRPGMWCEILRPSRTAIRTPFYRICSP